MTIAELIALARDRGAEQRTEDCPTIAYLEANLAGLESNQAIMAWLTSSGFDTDGANFILLRLTDALSQDTLNAVFEKMLNYPEQFEYTFLILPDGQFSADQESRALNAIATRNKRSVAELNQAKALLRRRLP